MPLAPSLLVGRTFKRIVAAIAMIALYAGTTLAPAIAGDNEGGGIRDEETEQLIRSYADPILRAAGQDPEQIPIYILNDHTINAFVIPGNLMFLHTGLLLSADRPLQVKGVIAHETGHIAEDHIHSLKQSMSGATIPVVIGMLLGAAAIAAGSSDAGIAAIIGGQHIAERSVLAQSRENESEADDVAISYLTKTHQSARGLLEVTEKFRRDVASINPDAESFAYTHPMPTERIAQFRDKILAQPYADKADTPEEQLRFDMVKAKLYAYLNSFKDTFAKYKAGDTSLPARYAHAIAYYKYPNVEKSLELTDALIADEPNNPYFYEFAGQMLFENGRQRQSADYLRKAVKLKPQSALIRTALAHVLIELEDPAFADEAIENLNVATDIERTNAFAWRLLGRAYDLNGDQAHALLATAEYQNYVNDKGRACQSAAKAMQLLEKKSPSWYQAYDIIQQSGGACGEN